MCSSLPRCVGEGEAEGIPQKLLIFWFNSKRCALIAILSVREITVYACGRDRIYIAGGLTFGGNLAFGNL